MSNPHESDVAGTVFDDSSPELTRRYADALIGAAESAGGVDAILDELEELIADVWQGRPEFAEVLRSPAVAVHERDRILVDAFQGRTLPVVSNFLRVLNRHGRLDLLGPIAHRARLTWDRKQGRQPVRVETAAPLDEDQINALREKLSGLLRATPVLRVEVVPELIGGLVIHLGDEVIDASVRTRYLEQFRKKLSGERTQEILVGGDRFLDAAS